MTPAPNPCPVCKQPVAPPDKFVTGWRIGCVGKGHCVQLYRGTSAELTLAAWNHCFKGAVTNEQNNSGANWQTKADAEGETQTQ